MDIILYDLTTSRGHHSIYFNRILSVFLENGFKTYVLFEDPTAVKQTTHQRVHLLDPGKYRNLMYTIIVQVISLFFGKSALSITHVLTIRQVINTHKLKNPLVFFAYMDSILPSVPYRLGKLLINFRFTGIYMLPTVNSSGYFDWQESDRLRREKYLELCCSGLFLHETYTRFFSDIFKSSTFYTLPELLYLDKSGTHKDRIKNKSNGRVIIGIIGSLVRKKNFLRFLETAVQLKRGYYFLIVGKWPKETYSESELEQMQDYLHQIKGYSWQETDEYIRTEEIYNELVDTCDIVWLHHPEHPFSSNSLIKAMAMKKPVLVAPGHIMEEVVSSYKWSAVVADNVEEIIKNICHLREHFVVPMTEYQRLMENHSPEKFRNQILKSIDVCQ